MILIDIDLCCDSHGTLKSDTKFVCKVLVQRAEWAGCLVWAWWCSPPPADSLRLRECWRMTENLYKAPNPRSIKQTNRQVILLFRIWKKLTVCTLLSSELAAKHTPCETTASSLVVRLRERWRVTENLYVLVPGLAAATRVALGAADSKVRAQPYESPTVQDNIVLGQIACTSGKKFGGATATVGLSHLPSLTLTNSS